MKPVTGRHIPTFSVVIFTKNRAELAGFALESVLRQSFEDFEVVVCDNDESDSTRKVIARYSDPRIRYHRTGGTLSMIDNWEESISLATGRYVTSLTDRSVLKRYALERISRAIHEHGQDVYVWQYDQLFERRRIDQIARYSAAPSENVVSSRSLFEAFLHNQYDRYHNQLPRGLNSCCSRNLLLEIRASTGGRLCLPIAPDHNLAFLTLLHRASVVLINEPLFVWGSIALSNGMGTYAGTDTFQRFLRDLNKTEADLYDKVPIKTVGIHNMLCNDLLNLKALLPARCANIEIDLPAYFKVCHEEIRDWLPPEDPLYVPKMNAWQEALDRQPNSVREAVLRDIERSESSRPQGRVPILVGFRRNQAEYHRGFVDAPWFTWGGLRGRVVRQLGRTRRALYRRLFPMRKPLPVYKFRTPLEAADWIEACEKWERQQAQT